MDYIQLTGIFAALFTTISNLPQAWKIIRTKSTKDVSLVTYLSLLLGLLLWVIYGVMRSDWPVIIANGVSVLLCLAVIFLKLTSKKVLEDLHDKVHGG